ncbi:hypothetical protein GCM10010435_85370 [Winogradskya consettensis]|uniref:DUF2809 domain-containing protein n=3 Tax=Winogradskya consettensis TaxID=113560 RepID=A0A919SIZ4_9ACTN|nr:hypothetical protein Aco04nite_31030 [Actinoplanes consettensis]
MWGMRRLVALGGVGTVIAVGLVVRAVGGGAFAANAGTVLYATMVFAGVYVVWPRVHPGVAGALAVAFCWAIELLQLTSLPAELSARSVLARLVLGSSFDWADMAWYPVGVVPVVVIALGWRRVARWGSGLRGVRRAG